MHNDGLRRLGGFDPVPFSVLRPRLVSPVLLVCDHASNRVPERLSGLGLNGSQIARHIGWDIGAAAVTRHLSGLLHASAVLSGVSRLVIDCNRSLDDPTSIPERSDGVVVPGNARLSAHERARRAAKWYWPYHNAIAAQLDRLERTFPIVTVVSIHSFTPVMDGIPRPWPIGVLWNRDPRLAPAIIAALGRQGHAVGDNEPYSGRDGGFTVDVHAAAHGRPHVTFEIRQDLIADPIGARRWSRRLAEVLRTRLRQSDRRRRLAQSWARID
jgi:predicted N-formylglutamate amidohydrolase